MLIHDMAQVMCFLPLRLSAYNVRCFFEVFMFPEPYLTSVQESNHRLVDAIRVKDVLRGVAEDIKPDYYAPDGLKLVSERCSV